jgi:hypothetical protein
MKTLSFAIIISILIGCSTPTTWEKHVYKCLEAQDAELKVEYKPGSAAALNILPGFGDAYNEEWGAFAINLLLWPISIVWGIPEAAITADNKNIRSTVHYYTIGKGKGKYQIDFESIEEAVKNEEAEKAARRKERLAYERGY